MALREEWKNTGNWLFKWRSYLPLPLVVLIFLGAGNFTYPYGSHFLDVLWELGCLCIAFLGLGIRILTVGYVPFGTSGRNTHRQVARVLNTSGMYSIVRHPLYLGNFFIWLGLSLYLRLWWITVITLLVFWLYYERIMFAEEAFLEQKFGQAFIHWAEETPALFPKISKWKKPQIPFSFRTVLRREYTSFFAVISSFTVLEIFTDWYSQEHFEVDYLWLTIFTCSLVCYLTIRIIKKHTTWLSIEGR